MELMTEDSLRIVISGIMYVKCTEGMHSKITITHVIDSVTHVPICGEFLKISPVTNIKKRLI